VRVRRKMTSIRTWLFPFRYRKRLLRPAGDRRVRAAPIMNPHILSKDLQIAQDLRTGCQQNSSTGRCSPRHFYLRMEA
jgi:hypothetical protein